MEHYDPGTVDRQYVKEKCIEYVQNNREKLGPPELDKFVSDIAKAVNNEKFDVKNGKFDEKTYLFNYISWFKRLCTSFNNVKEAERQASLRDFERRINKESGYTTDFAMEVIAPYCVGMGIKAYDSSNRTGLSAADGTTFISAVKQQPTNQDDELLRKRVGQLEEKVRQLEEELNHLAAELISIKKLRQNETAQVVRKASVLPAAVRTVPKTVERTMSTEPSISRVTTERRAGLPSAKGRDIDPVKPHQPPLSDRRITVVRESWLDAYNEIAASSKTDRESSKKRRDFFKSFELLACGNFEEVLSSRSAKVRFQAADSAGLADYLLRRQPDGTGYLLPVLKGSYEQAWYNSMKNLFDIDGYRDGAYTALRLEKPAIISSDFSLRQKGKIIILS